MNTDLEGIIVPVVTPFDDNGDVDFVALGIILEFLVERGVQGIMTLGSQGEFYALSLEEKRKVIVEVIRCTNKRIPVVVNVGEIATRASIELARYSETAGADAIAVLTPYFIKPTQEELIDHYKRICDSLSVPLFAYNNPSRTGVNLLPRTVAKLAKEVINFAGIKDSSGDLEQTAEYVRYSPRGFRVFIGRDTIIYGGLMYGVVGAVAATANVVPELVVGIYRAFRAGDHAKAKEIQERLAPLREAFSLGTFPGIVKEAMNMLGLPAGSARAPIQPLSGPQRENLHNILVSMDIMKTNQRLETLR